MTLDEARTLLGVDATASADEARRAYLKLVKRHRPEQDPLGFQRVREAYDLVREPRPFLFEGAALHLQALTASDVSATPVAEEGAWQVTSHESAEQVPDRSAGPDGELEGAFAAAMGHLRERDPFAALPFIEACLGSGSGSSYRGATLVIEALVRFAQQGEVSAFVKLSERFANHVKEDQVVLWGPHAARWLVLRELSVVAAELPEFVFGSLASSVFEEDAASLVEELGLYAAREPKQARRAQRVLKAYAPSLFSAYGALLVPVEPFKKGWKIGWVPIVALVFGLLRLFGGGTTSEEIAAPAPHSRLAVPRTPPLQRYDRTSVHHAIDELTWLAQEHRRPELQSKLVAVGEAFTGDCTSLAREVNAVVELTPDKDANMTNHARTLWTEFARACPLQAGEVPAP